MHMGGPWGWGGGDYLGVGSSRHKKKLLSLFHYFGWLAFFFQVGGGELCCFFFFFLATAMAYNSRLLEKETDKKMGLLCDCV